MMHISNLIDLSKARQEKVAENMEMINEDTAKIVNLLFRELQSIFPAFKQAWPTPEDFSRAKKNWVKAFIAVNINTVEQLRFGLQKSRLSGRPFAPSVGEFIAWCTPSPEDIGLPIFEKAYDISIRMNQQFSDYKPSCPKTYAVIKHVLEQIGSTNYRSMSAEKATKAFESYYAIACNQFAEGKLKEIPKAITAVPQSHPHDKARCDEARRKCMESLRGIGIISSFTKNQKA